MVDGVWGETELLLEARHEGQAPEIDGVVYLNDGQANSGDFVKVEITDAAAYDLVGRIVGGRPFAASFFQTPPSPSSFARRLPWRSPAGSSWKRQRPPRSASRSRCPTSWTMIHSEHAPITPAS